MIGGRQTRTFGDGWEHIVKIERLGDPEPGVAYQPGDEVAVDQSVSGAMTMTSMAGAPSMTARIAKASATSV